MPNIHLTLAGPLDAPYPNGGDEAYWMGQVAGALASHLTQRGIALCWGKGEKMSHLDLRLVLGSQAAPREQEGRKKGPAVLSRAGEVLSGRAAEALAAQLGQVYPQPELLTLEKRDFIPELAGYSGPSVAVRLLYRDNPQDEAWLSRNTGVVGKALAVGLSQALTVPFHYA